MDFNDLSEDFSLEGFPQNKPDTEWISLVAFFLWKSVIYIFFVGVSILFNYLIGQHQIFNFTIFIVMFVIIVQFVLGIPSYLTLFHLKKTIENASGGLLLTLVAFIISLTILITYLGTIKDSISTISITHIIYVVFGTFVIMDVISAIITVIIRKIPKLLFFYLIPDTIVFIGVMITVILIMKFNIKEILLCLELNKKIIA